ncbi:MAG TPA: RluA family pseudouridine synthase [Acidobacteriota bacterium]|jgi:23S rRNA pseudouridine1911/1915/1917 synthase
MQHQLIVNEEDAGSRLDKFLAHSLQDFSRTFFARLIDEQRVYVNGVAETRARRSLKAGDSISLTIPPPEPSTLQAEDLPLDVLYEDDWLAVVVKAAGMTVHPGAGRRSGTLANALMHRFGTLSRADPSRPGIVHRLDRDTSGLLLVAKNERAHHKLARQFQRREVQKHYLALVYGTGLDLHGKIELPVGRHPHHRTRMAVTRAGRPALTLYDVLETFAHFTYLKINLKTGRTHQIRVHLSHKNHPVVGDAVYGRGRLQNVQRPEIEGRLRQFNRLFLHAASLSFLHPKTGAAMTFESPLPPDLVDLLDFLRRND